MFRGAAYHVVKSRSKRHMLFGFLHLNFGIFDEKEGNLNPKIHVYVGFCYSKNSPKYQNVKYVCGLLEFRIKFILVCLSEMCYCYKTLHIWFVCYRIPLIYLICSMQDALSNFKILKLNF